MYGKKSHNILKCAGFFLLPVVHVAQGRAAYADFRTEEWLEDSEACGHGGPGSEHVIDEKHMVYTFDCQWSCACRAQKPHGHCRFSRPRPVSSESVCVGCAREYPSAPERPRVSALSHAPRLPPGYNRGSTVSTNAAAPELSCQCL